MTKKRLSQVKKRISKIKAQLCVIEEMRPGSLTSQYKNPKDQTGRYYQLSYTLEMKSRTDYIPKDSVEDIRREIKNYKKFKDLVNEWVHLGIEQSKLKLKLTSRQKK